MYGLGFGIGAIGATTKRSSGVAIDADAQAFFTANSTLTDATTKTAINQFIVNLKSFGLWDLRGNGFMCLGFLGNSTKVSIDLFKPSNTFSLTSGFDYNSYGIKGNGVSTYINSNFIPRTHASINSKTYFFYCQDNITEDSFDMGALGSDGDVRDVLLSRYYNQGGRIFFNLSNSGWCSSTNPSTDSRGFLAITRNNSTTIDIFKNNSILESKSSTTYLQTPYSVYLGAYNEAPGIARGFSTRRVSIYGQMLGLTSTQLSNLKTSIDTMLTSLSIPTF